MNLRSLASIFGIARRRSPPNMRFHRQATRAEPNAPVPRRVLSTSLQPSVIYVGDADDLTFNWSVSSASSSSHHSLRDSEGDRRFLEGVHRQQTLSALQDSDQVVRPSILRRAHASSRQLLESLHFDKFRKHHSRSTEDHRSQLTPISLEEVIQLGALCDHCLEEPLYENVVVGTNSIRKSRSIRTKRLDKNIRDTTPRMDSEFSSLESPSFSLCSQQTPSGDKTCMRCHCRLERQSLSLAEWSPVTTPTGRLEPMQFLFFGSGPDDLNVRERDSELRRQRTEVATRMSYARSSSSIPINTTLVQNLPPVFKPMFDGYLGY